MLLLQFLNLMIGLGLAVKSHHLGALTLRIVLEHHSQSLVRAGQTRGSYHVITQVAAFVHPHTFVGFRHLQGTDNQTGCHYCCSDVLAYRLLSLTVTFLVLFLLDLIEGFLVFYLLLFLLLQVFIKGLLLLLFFFLILCNDIGFFFPELLDSSQSDNIHLNTVCWLAKCWVLVKAGAFITRSEDMTRIFIHKRLHILCFLCIEIAEVTIDDGRKGIFWHFHSVHLHGYLLIL